MFVFVAASSGLWGQQTLPVYVVNQAGATALQSATLANYRNIPASIVLYIGHGDPSAISFIINGSDGQIGSCGYTRPLSMLWDPHNELLNRVAVEMPSMVAVESVHLTMMCPII